MATETPNYKLKKPGLDDFYAVEDQNDNMDKIDTAIKAAKDAAATAQTTANGKVDSVAGKKGVVSLVKGDVGLGNVDNTNDLSKPVSAATQTELNKKVDKETGKGLSQENYTTSEKEKLALFNSSQQHSHTNKSILDLMTAAYTTEEKNKVALLKTDQTAQKFLSGDGTYKSAGGKKYATIVVGTTTSGHTAADVDFLCDGVDDQIEINNAINSISSSIGGKVLLLEGNYFISTSGIVINASYVVLEGSGSGCTILKKTKTTSDIWMIDLTGDNCILQNFSILTENPTTLSYYGYGIRCKGNGNSIKHNKFDLYKDAIEINGSNNFVFGNEISSYMRGIYCRPSGVENINNNIISENILKNSQRQFQGININKCDYSIISDNIIDNFGDGIQMVNLKCCVVTGNKISNNLQDGFSITDVRQSTISGNLILGTGDATKGMDVYMSGTIESVCDGNICFNGNGLPEDYTGSKRTFSMSGSCARNIISNNSILGKDILDYGTNNTKVNNKFE